MDGAQTSEPGGTLGELPHHAAAVRLASALTLALLAAAASAQSGCEAEGLPDFSRLTTPPPAADSVAVRAHAVPLGDATVEVVVHERPGGRLDALVLHDDENAGVEAALEVIAAEGGRLVELRHTGARNVEARVGGRAMTADPNRIFTAAGRARTLRSLSAFSEAADAALAALADSLRAVYTASAPAVVVTLHNNTDARYAATSYGPGGDYEADAAAVTVHRGVDADDFFFVTDRAIYDALVARGFNAVLQDNAAATDDGSLSVWAAQNARPYVNVEAQHGHVEEQARMIRALLDVLDERAASDTP